MNGKRPVRRCLVMIDYGDGDVANGEVFDLTALVAEMLPRATYSARIGLDIRAERTYARDPNEPQFKMFIDFGGDAGGEWVSGASHLDDVINAALPDGDKVTAIKKRAERLRKKVDELRHDAMAAKLRQVAEIRHQHPIARFSEPLPQLPQAS